MYSWPSCSRSRGRGSIDVTLWAGQAREVGEERAGLPQRRRQPDEVDRLAPRVPPPPEHARDLSACRALVGVDLVQQDQVDRHRVSTDADEMAHAPIHQRAVQHLGRREQQVRRDDAHPVARQDDSVLAEGCGALLAVQRRDCLLDVCASPKQRAVAAGGAEQVRADPVGAAGVPKSVGTRCRERSRAVQWREADLASLVDPMPSTRDAVRTASANWSRSSSIRG